MADDPYLSDITPGSSSGNIEAPSLFQAGQPTPTESSTDLNFGGSTSQSWPEQEPPGFDANADQNAAAGEVPNDTGFDDQPPIQNQDECEDQSGDQQMADDTSPPPPPPESVLSESRSVTIESVTTQSQVQPESETPSVSTNESKPQYPELAEPYDPHYVYTKGEAVWRKGEKHIIVKVDYTLIPHAYDVKRLRDGAVINTEPTKLRPAQKRKVEKRLNPGTLESAKPPEPLSPEPRTSSPVNRKKHLKSPQSPAPAFLSPSGSRSPVVKPSPKKSMDRLTPRSAGSSPMLKPSSADRKITGRPMSSSVGKRLRKQGDLDDGDDSSFSEDETTRRRLVKKSKKTQFTKQKLSTMSSKGSSNLVDEEMARSPEKRKPPKSPNKKPNRNPPPPVPSTRGGTSAAVGKTDGLMFEESSDSDGGMRRSPRLSDSAGGSDRKQVKRRSTDLSSQYADYEARKPSIIAAPRGAPTEVKVGGNPAIGPRGRVDRRIIGKTVMIEYGPEDGGNQKAVIARFDPRHDRYVCEFKDGQEPDLFTWDDLHGSDCEILSD